MQVMEDPRKFVYRIDLNDRVVFANANWYDFARENDADELCAEAIIGRSLWEFIVDEATQDLFKILLSRIRQTGVSVTLPFRCDGPDLRRFMEVTLVPTDGLDVEFQNRIVRLESRKSVPLLKQDIPRTDELLLTCGWCKKIMLPGRRWVDVEVAVSELRLFDAPSLPRLSHGICEPCANSILQESQRLMGLRKQL